MVGDERAEVREGGGVSEEVHGYLGSQRRNTHCQKTRFEKAVVTQQVRPVVFQQKLAVTMGGSVSVGRSFLVNTCAESLWQPRINGCVCPIQEAPSEPAAGHLSLSKMAIVD